MTTDVSVAGLSNGAHARTLPHDTNAEQSVLGALFIDQDAIAIVRDVLEPSDFYAEKHQHIYRAAAALHDKGEPIDVVTVRAQLEKDGTVSRAGGVDYLAELTLAVPTAVSAKHYADIVVNNALRRRLINAGTTVAAMGYDNTITAEDAIDQAEQKIFGVAEQQRTDEAVHLAPIVKETWVILEERLKSKKLVHGVPTNFAPLDAVTQGLQPGELTILAARPSVGKTSFALNIARNASLLARRGVVIFSLEMTKQSLVQRLICSEAAVDSHLLNTGQADAFAFQRIAKAMDALIETPLWIDDTPALSISTLRARARRLVAQYKIELVVVDYLQLMRGGRQESRVQEVSDISSGLKSISKELSIPVLALSQLSRESERRENRQPQLSDLRDSGCLTGDSRVFVVEDNRHIPIRELVGRDGFSVLSVNPETWQLEERTVTKAFSSGIKDTFKIELRSGRTIRASGNHKFLAFAGWKRLDQLTTGDVLAIPRSLSQGVRSHGAIKTLTAVGAADGYSEFAPFQEWRDAESDVYWDEIVNISQGAKEEVFDLTVEGLHNFVANGMIVHNSIEQDADVVLFLYRPGMHKEEIDKSVTELLVAKNRNGPTTKIDLHFVAQQTTFRDVHRGPTPEEEQ